MTGGMNGGNLNIGGRVNPPAYQHQDSALANSLLNHQQYQVDPISGQYLYPQPDDMTFQQEFDDRYALYLNEAGPGSRTGSKYGSPINDQPLPISGVERRLTALDAPLPASFDSNGISHIARYGAVAASVPSMFQMESPPASFPHRVAGQPVDAVKALRTSLMPSTLRNSSQFGSSPPTINTEEASIQRRMHSQQAVQRPRLLSASVPRPVPSDDWDEGFPLEEDQLPMNLHDDILTPQEKMRRLSRPEQDFGAFKSSTQNAGGLGIPSANSSKVGSPLASSPSRFSALFARQKQEASGNPINNQNTNPPVGTFGQVGSPLRESHIQNAASISPAGTGPFGDGVTARPSPSIRSRAPPGLSPLDRDRDSQAPSAFAGPPQNPSSAFGMSLISSQLQRTHLSPRNANDNVTDPSHSSSSRLQPSTAGMRHVSAPTGLGSSNTSPTGQGGGGRLDRHSGVSSPRMHSTRIAEEGEGDLGVFSMDDDVSRRGWGGKSPVIAPMGADGSAKAQSLPQSAGTGFGTIGAEKKEMIAASGPAIDKGVRTAVSTAAATATSNGRSR